MSSGLAPSKSTVYVSNLVYSLTNNDLHKIFSKYGKVVKVTLVKDKSSRKSKGVAFVQFLRREEASACVNVLNGKQMFERTVKCSIAKDNGRSTEFIRKKYYPDKTTCYECKESGHLSYDCPKNSLGRRTPPPKKDKKKRNTEDTRKKKNIASYSSEEEFEAVDEETNFEPDLETLSAAIQMEQQKVLSTAADTTSQPVRKIIKKNSYFSDEEDLSD